MKMSISKVLKLWLRMSIFFCCGLLSGSSLLTASGATITCTANGIALRILIAFAILLFFAFIMTLAESRDSSNK